MATAYTETDCVGSALLTTIQTAILASSDWSRPNSGSLPTLFKCTADNGAQMCVDLNTTALTSQAMGLTYYRTHDGTTAGTSLAKFLRIKSVAQTLATTQYHVIVSAGKNHLFISVEGPRSGESVPDNVTIGSLRRYIMMSSVLPYFDNTKDLAACIAVSGDTTSAAQSAVATVESNKVWVSRNAADTQTWVPGKLAVLTVPQINDQATYSLQQITSPDGAKPFFSPYVVFENAGGVRGRLSSFFFAGPTVMSTYDVGLSPVGEIVTIDGVQYKLLAVNRSDGSNDCWGPFGTAANGGSSNYYWSPVVAVPYA